MIGPSTSELALGWSFTTVTPVRLILPALLTMPLYFNWSPGPTVFHTSVEQILVTTSRGRVSTGHVAVCVSVTVVPVQMSLPVALTVLETEQQFNGTV